ncbi:hypothetical protein B4U79_16845, partial [Dinothrombium tinctorium]
MLNKIPGSNTVILTPRIASREEYNTKVLGMLEEYESFTYHANDTDGIGNPISKKRAEKYCRQTNCQFPSEITLKLNGRVMLIKNYNIKDGWVNGTIAHVTGLRQDMVCIKDVHGDQKEIWIKKLKTSISIPGKVDQYFRTQIPLQHAYAITIHKAQGLTLGRVVMDLSDIWESGQAYVALSRVKKFDQIEIISYDKEKIYLHPYCKQLLNWIDAVNYLNPKRRTDNPPPPEMKQFYGELVEEFIRPLPRKTKTHVTLPTIKPAQTVSLEKEMNVIKKEHQIKTDESPSQKGSEESQSSDDEIEMEKLIIEGICEELLYTGEFVEQLKEQVLELVPKIILDRLDEETIKKYQGKEEIESDTESTSKSGSENSESEIEGEEKMEAEKSLDVQAEEYTYDIYEPSEAENLRYDITNVYQTPVEISNLIINRSLSKKSSDFEKLEATCLKHIIKIQNILKQFNTPSSFERAFFEQYARTQDFTVLTNIIYRVLYCKIVFTYNQITNFHHENSIEKYLYHYHHLLRDSFHVYAVAAQGDCFYNSISTLLFGNQEFVHIIRMSIVTTYVRRRRLLSRMNYVYESPWEFIRLCVSHHEWANEQMINVITIATGRPYHNYVVQRNNAPVPMSEDAMSLRRLSNEDSLNVLNGVDQSCSHKIIYLPTDPQHSYNLLKQRRKLAQLPKDSKDVFLNSKLDNYMTRPSELEDVCYHDFYEQYLYSYNVKREDGIKDTENPKRVIAPRKQYAIVRWHMLKMTDDIQRYCEQQLILYVPFRKSSDIFTYSSAEEKNFLQECLLRSEHDERFKFGDKFVMSEHFLDQARFKGFNAEQILDLAKTLVEQGFYDEDNLKSYMMCLDFDLDQDIKENAFAYEEVGELDMEEQLYAFSPMKLDQVEAITKKFTAHQGQTYREIMQEIRDENKQCLSFITGGAGVGKTYLVRAIVAALKHEQIPHAVVATTGIASKIAQGTTIHSFFKLDMNLQCRLDFSTIEAEMIRSLKVLIIDEVSMMSATLLRVINSIMQSVNDNPEKWSEPFGGRNVILVGDPAQLPVVEGFGIWNNNEFLRFKVYSLGIVIRQSDPNFIKILNEVRRGIISEECEKYLKSRIINDVEEMLNKIPGSNTVILTPRIASREEYNTKVLGMLEEYESFTYHANDTDGIGNPISKKRAEKYCRQTNCQFPSEITLKLNGRVMLIKNYNIKDGWVNGTIAHVTGLRQDMVCIKDVHGDQ